ncbi:MAG TPA: SoxR reducing system RseC family protein [Myxococcota bacterium]|nr:SoxR reducing system RseC family protein [Myxococcota bacterium]HOH76882.1 SoxR reducing system RseC family protein [Myxococcota bacterium]
MVETARVVEVGPSGSVTVEVTRHEACGTCAARGACHPGGLKTGRVVAVCGLPCTVGDTVEISISDSAVRFAVLWAYVVPAGLLLASLSAVWYALSGTELEGSRDIIAGIAGLAGAGLGFLIMKLVNGRIRRPGTKAHERFTIRVVRILD